jgi:hypothetical protein
MCDPARQRFQDRFFVGESTLGPLALELPVQICGRPFPPLGTRDLVHNTVTVTRAKAGSVRASAREIADNLSLYFHDFRIIILPFCRKVPCKYQGFTVQG